MRILFAFLLLIHGLIHLMGFAKAYRFADISQLHQPVSKPAGMLWLLAAVLFVTAAGLFLYRKETWWMAAAAAAAVSQGLILSAWQDARFGTLANVIVLVVALVGYGRWNFDRLVQSELKTMLAPPVAEKKTLTSEMLAPLPPVVQKWLVRSGAVGRDMAHTVHIKQAGEMKTAPDGKWVPFTAVQYSTVDQPGFLWKTELRAAPLTPMTGRDKYENGRGHMFIQLFSLFTVADAKGPEVDQGALLRYLAEICWYPSAALRDYIRWEPVDSVSARATMTYGGVSGSGLFRFNVDGDLTGIEAKRYYTRKGGATLEDWHIETKGWKEMAGLRIPCQSEVTWKLKGGDFTWLKLEITALELNEIKAAVPGKNEEP
jgi:hypothetical protein